MKKNKKKKKKKPKSSGRKRGGKRLEKGGNQESEGGEITKTHFSGTFSPTGINEPLRPGGDDEKEPRAERQYDVN